MVTFYESIDFGWHGFHSVSSTCSIARLHRLKSMLIPDVLPMPRLVEIGPEPEATRVLYKPAIDRTLSLKRTIFILGVDRLAAHVQIKRASSRMRTVSSQSRASAVRRFFPQLILVFLRAVGGDYLKEFFIRRELTIFSDLQSQRRIGGRRRHHSLVSRVRLATCPAKLFRSRGVIAVSRRNRDQVIRVRMGPVLQPLRLESRNHAGPGIAVQHTARSHALCGLPNRNLP